MEMIDVDEVVVAPLNINIRIRVDAAALRVRHVKSRLLADLAAHAFK